MSKYKKLRQYFSFLLLIVFCGCSQEFSLDNKEAVNTIRTYLGTQPIYTDAEKIINACLNYRKKTKQWPEVVNHLANDTGMKNLLVQKNVIRGITFLPSEHELHVKFLYDTHLHHPKSTKITYNVELNIGENGESNILVDLMKDSGLIDKLQ